MRNLMRSTVFSVTLLLLISVTAAAQDNKIKEASLLFIPSANTASYVFEIDILLTNDLDASGDADINPLNVSVKTVQSGRSLNVIKASRSQSAFQEISIELGLDTLPTSEDTEFKICFKLLSFKNPSDSTSPIVKRDVCANGKIERKEQILASLEQLTQALKEVPKSSTEKNIFASGFVTSGAGEDSEGGAELNLNSPDLNIPGLTAFARLKKSTAEDADPKHFNIGLNYRSTLLFHQGTLAEIRDLQNRGDNGAAQMKFDGLRRAVWSSITFDFATKFEAEALSFDVANFVGEGLMQIKSRVLPLRGRNEKEPNSNRTGFYRFHIIPLGIEVGQNLNDGDLNMMMEGSEQSEQSEEIDWIARYKFGGGLTLFYSDKDSKWLFKRVEWDTQFVGRYLFRDEVMFDESTMMNIATDKGFKPWFQTALNAYVADTPNGRFGFRLNYNRGSLPPVFADTNSFQFGFIFETADDSKKR